MTQLTCDKLMKSNGSIKTFRANKVYRAVKNREIFSFTLFPTVNIITHNPPKMILLFTLQLRKNHRNPR